MNQNKHNPRIYVACASADEAGLKHGRWLDATADAAVLREQVQQMLAASPIADAEDFYIGDSDDFCSLDISDDADLEYVSAAARLVARWGEAAAVQIEQYRPQDIDHVRQIFEHGLYHGAWDSENDWGRDLLENLGDLEALADDEIDAHVDRETEFLMDSSYYSLQGDDKVHVFSR